MAHATIYNGGLIDSLSRRPSMGYEISAPTAYGGYTEPGLQYSHSPYAMHAQPSVAVVPHSRRLSGPCYDDVHGHTDAPYYDDGTYGRYSYSRPVTPHALTHAIPSTTVVVPPPPMRHRTHSGVSYVSPLNGRETYSHYRHGDRPGNLSVKFKRKGAFMAGIGLDEAQSHIRLSNNDAYSLHDLHADSRGRILLKVKWAGRPSLTYEIPLNAYDGRVDLSTLARRVSRACVHYLQAYVSPTLWLQVELHHLEEISYGLWQPMLSTH